MDDVEYSNVIRAIINDGRTAEAMSDLSHVMGRHTENLENIINEVRAERKEIKCLCDSEQSDKEKVEAIRSLL